MLKSIYDPRYEQRVKTPKGVYRGFLQRTTYHFLGLPYGKAERWQPAVPLEPWPGIVNCMQFGDVCPTFSGYKPLDDNFIPRPFFNKSEDCLNINIWTQSIDPEAKKPVFFWIHGGGFADGSSLTQLSYDGEALSTYGDIVFVSVNARLNIWGYLDVSDYGEEYKDSSVCGMSDIVLALQWVQENIKYFGGDPENVTIGGQSGGGGKATALMQIPAADGLYHKVIVQSGVRSVSDRKVEKDFSDKVVELMLKKIGSSDFKDLKELDRDVLVDTYMAIEPELKACGYSSMGWGPREGEYFTGYALRDGFTEYGKKVPFLTGSNISEFGKNGMPGKDALSEAEREAKLAELTGGKDPAALIDAYRKAWPGKNILEARWLDDQYRPYVKEYCSLKAAASEAPVWNYIFALEFPYNGGTAAWHSSEIPIVFHNSDLYPEFTKLGKVMEEMEEQMCSAWVSFMRTGDPNNEKLPLAWPRYRADAPRTYVFDRQCEVKDGEFDTELQKIYAEYHFPKPGPAELNKKPE